MGVGDGDGETVGDAVGEAEGDSVGDGLGLEVGVADGDADGVADGDSIGDVIGLVIGQVSPHSWAETRLNWKYISNAKTKKKNRASQPFLITKNNIILKNYCQSKNGIYSGSPCCHLTSSMSSSNLTF